MVVEFEKMTVIGAGGIGGTVAGFLAMAGEKVTVVDRSVPHIEAIRSNGLLVDGIFGEHRVKFQEALLPEEMDRSLDLVILAVKSQDTENALATITPLLSDDGAIVSLQNGLNGRRIAEIVGSSRTIGGMVHVAADHLGPGHIRRFNRGQLYIGELNGSQTGRIQEISERLSQAVPTHTTNNVWGYLWAKQVYSCLHVATALVDAPSTELLKPEWCRRIFLAMMGEAVQVALAEDVILEKYDRFDPRVMLVRSKDDVPRALQMLPTESDKGYSGTWLDIKVRHRKTEIEFLTGEVVRLGRKHGLPMAINSQIFRMVKEIEEGKRNMSWENLRSLEESANAVLPK